MLLLQRILCSFIAASQRDAHCSDSCRHCVVTADTLFFLLILLIPFLTEISTRFSSLETIPVELKLVTKCEE